MIKFFRKIRFDLMEKNKTGKYVKYAIGEIVLVVIGILIALSINNWNGQRVIKKLELNTLEELKTALIQDTVKLNVDLNIFRNKQKRIELLLDHINNRKPYHDSLDTFFRDAYAVGHNNSINISAYELLRERGIDIISNDTLRKKITKHYSTRYSIYNGNIERGQSVTLMQASKMFNHFHYVNHPNSKPKLHPYNYNHLMENPQFFGPFFHFNAITGSIIVNIRIQKRLSKVLIEAINSEINQRNN